MRWQVVDPQNRIRRLQPVADGTVNVEIFLDSDDPAAVAAVEQAAADAGIELTQVAAPAPAQAPMAARPQPDEHGRVGVQVVVNGVQYVPVLPS